VPFSKTTRPVGVPLNSGVTVAVKVTDCPKVDGFSVEISEVVLLALPTNNFTALDVLEMKIASPLYTALIAYDPFAKEVDKFATPPLSVAVPTTLAPCMNVTVSPSGGGPMLELTLALKVTG